MTVLVFFFVFRYLKDILTLVFMSCKSHLEICSFDFYIRKNYCTPLRSYQWHILCFATKVVSLANFGSVQLLAMKVEIKLD